MTGQTSFLVSIIISTFNNEATVGTCLASLSKQTYSNFEIIVVDEYSKDKTVDIARQYGAKVYQKSGERSNCRNFGILNARGNYILVLDSDMELEPEVLEECVTLVQSGARAIAIKEISKGEGYWSKVRSLERSCYPGDDVVEAARFFEKDLITKIGGYDPKIVGAEDWDVHQKIINLGIKPFRTKSQITHHEGRLTFWRLVKKKAYYGAAFNEFRKRYPKIFKKAIIRRSLLRNLLKLMRRPVLGGGIFILKFCEGLALFWGMGMAYRGEKSTHY
jgi:glycosyltransferase involved in cell wall biosynthesis